MLHTKVTHLLTPRLAISVRSEIETNTTNKLSEQNVVSFSVKANVLLPC